MREITVEELESLDCYLIGDVLERKAYYPAIIGISKDKNRVVYNYDLLICCFVTAYDWSYEEAVDWIDYNVIRALPYYKDKAPVIVNTFRINKNNKHFDSIQIKTT